MLRLLAEVGPAIEANISVQAVLRNTVPGSPDLYQGCECLDLSLVDSDNRRPVDFDKRSASLKSVSNHKQKTDRIRPPSAQAGSRLVGERGTIKACLWATMFWPLLEAMAA